ncbi:MAG TPA: hypothetical protein VFZ61_16220, partial [Polyangiales bacterium]
MTRRHHSLLYALLLSAPASLAAAQTAAPPPPPPPPPPAAQVAATKGALVSNDKISRLEDKPQGWSFNLKLAANLSVISNKDVVGQLDGNGVLVGANILTGAGYLHGKHEWLNMAALSGAFSKSPDIRFVKAGDLLDVQTIYNYFINPYTGPFVRAQLQSSILKTERVTSGPVEYIDKNDPRLTDDDPDNDPQPDNPTDAVPPDDAIIRSSHLRLADAFQPLTISESVGWFAQPIHAERLNVFGRAGFGGRHTFANGARAIDDNKNTPLTEFVVLNDVHQAGIELFAGIDGKEVDGKILYALGATALFPLINNDDANRSIAKLTRVQLQAAVGVGIVSWMSINYMLRVVRDIQLVDAIQVTNSLLLSFQYSTQYPTP